MEQVEVKKCEWRNCCNFFTVGRKRKFCCAKCNLAAGRDYWKKRNPDFKKGAAYRERENCRRRKKYAENKHYREKIIDKTRRSYERLMQDEEWRKQRRQLGKNWRSSDTGKEWHNEYQKQRYKVDYDFKMRCNLRARIRIALKSQGAKRLKNTEAIIGCSIHELRKHLESQFAEGMTWDNHGDWHIDHIKPCAAFDLTNEEQQRECFHYSNLQPLWAVDNIKKGASLNYIGEENAK